MNYLYIVVPYENASLRVPIWAFEEKDIDFCREYDRALRCTMSFAAMELKKFLERTLDGVSVFFLEQQPKHGFFIDLQVENYTTEKVQKDRLHLAKAALQLDQYIIEPVNSGVKITGTSRAGLLYGAYEFLKLQGWQWIAPGETGEIVPQLRDNLVLPEKRIEFKPSMSLRRGFHMEGVSKESEELCLWMARNRLNNIGYRPATGPIAKKLGMYLQAGGHIFEEILNPDNVMPSGRTLWEEHTEWYGLPENGIRKKENVLGTQFCVSNEDLMEFLGAALLNLIMNEWKDADQIDIWGFDTWGKTCTCEACTRIGNSSDQTLHFLSAMRQYLDKANTEGKLGHHVNLIMCIYEGTATLQPPMNPIPANLHESGDFVTFFPINRCYAHDLFDDACEDNRKYQEAIIGWLNCEPSIPLIVCEYYNVSKFEDLPLLFNTRLERDLPAYYKHGVRGMYYMHIPMVNWGMRTVTQNLFAALSWDDALDVPMFVENYYTAWYGPYASHMKEVYELVERAWRFCAQWRAWASDSVLSALQRWDGRQPKAPLKLNEHFPTMEDVIKSGLQSVEMLENALSALNAVYEECKKDTAKAILPETVITVNPIQSHRLQSAVQYEMRLGEDRRLLKYGLYTMDLMTKIVVYYNDLYQGEKQTETLWNHVENIADKLDSCYIPIDYEFPGAGLVSKDSLTRTQLREVLRRCRKFRTENH